MNQGFTEERLADYFHKLSPKNQARIIAHIIMLLESQKQDVDWPESSKKRK